MSLNSITGEDDITAQLKTIPGVDVMEGDYTVDSYVPVVDANKLFNPYILVKFNGAFPANDNGITTPDLDTQRATFTVFVVSPDDRTTRDIRGQVRQKMLTNFSPTDASTLKPVSGLSVVDSDTGYQRYVHALTFAYYFNLNNQP